MLLAVEGGGFFSSSASGYSKGISLLLLGKKSGEKPMRVTPWSQYQLVNHKTDTDLELASRKNNKLLPGCTSFVCFGRAAAGLKQQEVSPASADDDSLVEENTNTPANLGLKSSLKKPSNDSGGGGDCETKVSERSNDVSDHIERRKVQWTDTDGGELFEIREFEPSDDESDDEFDSGNEKSCLCKVM